MEQTIAHTEGLTFEKVWLMFQETDRKFQETDQKFKELREDMKETDRKISKLGSRIGQLIEHLAASNILEKFRDMGYEFTCISRNNVIKDEKRNILAEIDLMLENGEYVMIVEVKSLFSREDVKDHLQRMQTLRKYADAHEDKRKYVGAAAGALIEETTRGYALESGLYVIEQSGDRVSIAAPGKTRVW